ncbi:hypothetical protein N7475_007918 [Penicillium sp. IBT 31633x]|nr:hypothetical protein N7475_007918 [Penicillium sp. IBT 31633x]
MYEPTTSLSLHRLSRHSLQDRYESDEEAVSESDAGAQDLLSSPIGSQAAEIFDSDLSADDTFHTDPVFDEDEHTILAPPTVKRPRPVSSATKRNSNATFDSDTYVFDPEEQLVLELPSPESSPEMAPRTFLQPSIYVWPNSPRPANSRSRSASPTSIFSIEEADIQVAKKVTIMEPPTRPTVVLINALGSRPKSSRSRPSHSRSRESSRIRPTLVRADSRLGLPRSSEPSTKSARVSERKTTMRHPSTTTPTPTPQEDLQLSPSATINRVSEIPPVLYFPAPPRTIPAQEYRTRPSTTGSDITMPPPLNVRSRRPPSMRSTSSSHPSRPTTPFSPENTPIPLTKPTNHTNHTDLPPPSRTSLQSCLNLIPLTTPIHQAQCQLNLQRLEHPLQPLATHNTPHNKKKLLLQRALAQQPAL